MHGTGPGHEGTYAAAAHPTAIWLHVSSAGRTPEDHDGKSAAGSERRFGDGGRQRTGLWLTGDVSATVQGDDRSDTKRIPAVSCKKLIINIKIMNMIDVSVFV